MIQSRALLARHPSETATQRCSGLLKYAGDDVLVHDFFPAIGKDEVAACWLCSILLGMLLPSRLVDRDFGWDACFAALQ